MIQNKLCVIPHLQQKHESSCLAACFAMLTGLSYDRIVKELYNPASGGIVMDVGFSWLEKQGFECQCLKIDPRKCKKPVLITYKIEHVMDNGNHCYHAVVMLPNGDILDPEYTERYSIEKLNNIRDMIYIRKLNRTYLKEWWQRLFG